MKVNFEYLRKLLEQFEVIDKPFPLITQLESDDFPINSEFAFHMGLLLDQNFIQYLTRTGSSPFEPDLDDADAISWFDCHVRLTSQGYDFLSALKQKDIWNALKGDFKENSIETVWKVAQGSLTKLATVQLQKLIDSSSLK
ncbi:DUF2513 domain-containing protein [Shewanella pneumatophori]|uniref:DUF2513 domain-containing protein n=1 Tax=Shewanella pneumatophori TaxID=314092 RepID=A0A9X1ZDS8_9GAMM|nr:DUF2513 domain-containing protein [Shewanella pneumatophori]MCL1138270.1 DUF2513 domain-containing protein [Shewanella pneumatophori]